MSVYYQRRRQRRRAAWQSYLFPLVLLFLVVIGAFFVVKGLIYLFGTLTTEELSVSLYTEQGRVEVKPVGETESLAQLIPGQPVFAGDVISTGPAAQAVLVFFDKTQVRLAANTQVELTTVKGNAKEENVLVTVNSGEVWTNLVADDLAKEYNYTFETANQRVNLNADATFDLKAKIPEYLRVLDGNVLVDVKTGQGEDAEVIAGDIAVSIAQEFILTAEALSTYKSNGSPRVLEAIKKDFESSDWYAWNTTLDQGSDLVFSFDGKTPIAVVSDNDESEDEDLDSVDSDNEEDDSSSDESDTDEATSTLPKPVVVTPDDGSVLTTDTLIIDGTTAADTDKIEVTSFENGRAKPYILQRYEAGSKTWRYVATFSGGNLVIGENIFEVRALDADGNASKATIVKITYAPEKESDSDSAESTEAGVDIGVSE